MVMGTMVCTCITLLSGENTVCKLTSVRALELFHALLNGQIWAFIIRARYFDPLAHFLQRFLWRAVPVMTMMESSLNGKRWLTRSISPNSSAMSSIFALSSAISSSWVPVTNTERQRKAWSQANSPSSGWWRSCPSARGPAVHPTPLVTLTPHNKLRQSSSVYDSTYRADHSGPAQFVQAYLSVDNKGHSVSNTK